MHSMENKYFLQYENEIYFFIKISQHYFHLYQEHLEMMEQEDILLTILFGEFGGCIVDDFFEMNKEKRIKIFDYIETMMLSEDEYLNTATATGLVEAIISKAESKDKSNELLIEILTYCKEETMRYIVAWSRMLGIDMEEFMK
ncbi:DUF7674 family protein [Aliarcobacter butzleri]|uniref:DUF7674 family protein n=1 Tax=Aliarcobacter butzleri TaxID=28197 RepID=UPI00344CE13F